MTTLQAIGNEALVGYAALFGVLILCFVMLRSTYRKLREPGPSPREYAREQIDKLKNQKVMRGNMEELLVQLQELSRSINAQIDTKFAKLETSIRSADERIAKLKRLQHTLVDHPKIDTIISDDHPSSIEGSKAAAPAAAQAVDPRLQAIYDLADAGKSPIEIARLTGELTGEIELILSLRRGAKASS